MPHLEIYNGLAQNINKLPHNSEIYNGSAQNINKLPHNYLSLII